ncbi:iron chelate uptake ABC transporter family permease subunit [Pelagibacterium xiamenense]|uniref:iron chelate uptake ABC transporter family permease subunit n=1 Tax=Pelagibacterium xiamenense TaxID=2901140 RepID=UPI001E5B5F0E|nr:iron chelate uptake ABC transporter family permease subunit [Pelagibacterium xiamenense]MCD7060803.1 iron chelate uptake ABC transporter family permease subunit [Pelagibacterium xiamenense]
MADVLMMARRRVEPAHVLAILCAVAVLCVVLFMTLGARGSWSFIIPFRGAKVAQMALVGYAIAVSTVLFQTVTHNRILTPSIMGFDAMYVLIQTTLVFFIGGLATATIDPRLMFVLETVLMVAFALALFRWLFTGAQRSLHLLVLVGIIIGTFFRSFSSFMQRIIDPNEFAILQDRFFASFNTVNSELLLISSILIGAVSVVAWRIHSTFDVLALGRENAINLGVDYNRVVRLILILVAILVSVSTALVGPVTFFGLLVANLAYIMIGSARHRHVIPAAALLAFICLVGGQMLLERVFAFNTALSIIIEFLGGVVFILLILRGAAR